MSVIEWISGIGQGGAVFVLILLWQEIKHVRSELFLLLTEHEKQINRLNAKVFPAWTGAGNETAQMVG